MSKKGSAEKTIRNIRRKTRRLYSSEEKIRIVARHQSVFQKIREYQQSLRRRQYPHHLLRVSIRHLLHRSNIEMKMVDHIFDFCVFGGVVPSRHRSDEHHLVNFKFVGYWASVSTFLVIDFELHGSVMSVCSNFLEPTATSSITGFFNS